jgi:protein-S-isoprenylcysteine O-methyltransferase Ste14
MSSVEHRDPNSDASVFPALPENDSNSVLTLEVLGELGGRAILMAFFGMLALHKAQELQLLITRWAELGAAKYLDLAAILAALAFLLLTVGATIFRFKPIRRAEGWQPRFSAFMGSFLTLSLIALPPLDAGPAWQATSILTIIVGGLLSAWVLTWLGRSFSVTPQARHLVTAGPYSVVRHPLYLCEEFTVIGVMMLYLSPLAVLIVMLQWIFQLRRMDNEEHVLRSAFPEYAAYAGRTPKIIPGKFRAAG